MTFHIYTAEEIAELTTLADEARELDGEWRVVMAEVGAEIDRVAGFTIEINGQSKRCIAPRWTENSELAHLVDVAHAEYRVAPYAQLPQAGQGAYKRIHRAAEWRKLNNRARREIAKARKAVAARA